MLFTLALLLMGLILIFLEFFLPGGVIGSIGGLLLLSSMLVFALRSDSWLYTAFYFIFCLCSLYCFIRFALYRIKKASPGDSVYHKDDQEGYVASIFDEEVVGKEGIVDSDLKPSGHILVQGVRHQALSKSGYVVKGEKVLVIGGQGAYLTVKKR